MQRLARRVVLLGWDGADWDVIHPLLDAGEMPGLQSIVENGVSGNLASLAPLVSPLLATSIATGHPPDRHDILSFQEPDPTTGGVRTASAGSRKVKALWNIFTQAGLNSIVLNWYASHPAEPIGGVAVSDLYPRVRAPLGSPWPLAAGAVHPVRLREKLAELRVHPGEITGDDLLPFLPQLARIDQKKDLRPQRLAVELAETLSLHSAATWLMENEPWDFLGVWFPSLDRLCHHFLPYYPPQMAGIADEEFELYRDVVPGIYRYQDMLLRRILQLAGAETTFVVISSHGFQSGEHRPAPGAQHLPGWEEDLQPEWQRPRGIFCAAGPGLRRDELVFGAGLLDLAPFLLALFGLPAGEDMPGRVLPDAFEEPPREDRIASWETAPGECGALPEDEPAERWEDEQVLAQLAALGYISEVPEQTARSAAELQARRNYTLARVYLEAGRIAEAIPALERALTMRPVAGMRLALAQCYLMQGRNLEARNLVDTVLAAEGAKPHALLVQANLELAEGRPGQALVLLAEAERMPYPTGMLQFRIGCVYQAMERWEDAERAFANAGADDREFAPAHRNRAHALLRLGRHEEAASCALDAIALRYDDASSHYILGVALAKLRRFERAVQAFETSIRLKPSPLAHDWLAAIHEAGGAAEQARLHREESRALAATV